MKRLFLLFIIVLFTMGCITTSPRQQSYPQQQQFDTKIPEPESLLDMTQEAALLGSLTSTALGRHIGNYVEKMDSDDKKQLARTFENQPSGITKRWHNIESDIVYGVTPTRTHQYTDGSMCREYVIELYRENDVKEFYGRSCRQTDGTWVIVN